MTSRPPDYQPDHDQSDRRAHPWSVAEPGSWTELAESTAFVFRAGGLSLHPLTIALCAVGALVASWTLPIGMDELLPWLGEHGAWGTVWAWFRLTWFVGVVCVCGTMVARTIAARPTRAAVWGVLPPMVASAGICVSTFISTLAGTVLAAWLMTVIGEWIGGAFGASLATFVGFVALLCAGAATVLLLLAIPAIATNDADAPDAIQRAAANLIARPGLSVALLAICVCGVGLAVLIFGFLFEAANGLVTAEWDESAQLGWLPNTVYLFVALALGWAALTQALLTLREVVDREDRASCWDPRPQAEAIHQAIEARAIVSGGRGDSEPGGEAGSTG